MPRLLIVLTLGMLMTPAAWADRALLIGIDAYHHDPHIGPLSGAVNDARNMHGFVIDHLHYPPDAVRLLLDAEATRQGMVTAIEDWLIRGTQAGDRVLLFFAGHGAQVPSQDKPNEQDQILVAVDTYLDAQGHLHNFIRDKELGRILDRLPDRRVTVIVDACHSGAITRSIDSPQLASLVRTPLNLARVQNLPLARARSGPAEQALLPSTPNRTVWTAVSSHQLAFEDIEQEPRVGFFTGQFIRGIAEAQADLNGDGQVTHLELHRWLERESAAYCERLGSICQFGLTPTLEVERSLQVVPVQATLVDPAIAGSASVPAVADSGLVAPAPTAGMDSAAAGEVSLQILPQANRRLGQTVRFQVTSDFDGYLLVLNIDPAGRLMQLFPNRYSERQGRGQWIDQGRAISIPDATYGFEFVVQEPLGAGRVLALVTADPVDLSAIVSPARSLEPMPVGQAQDYLLLIAEHLRQTWNDGGQQRPLHWAIGVEDYRTGR